jgi:mono/diheme cytochrome c family protein
MALLAYGQLDRLDADAHYHLGRIHAVVGDLDNIRKQIGILRQFTPNHLLATILEHAVAEQSRDKDAAARAYAAFVAAYDTETNAGRQEYADHRITIENFRKAAGESRVALTVTGLVGAAREGAGLFAKSCAICHGQNASGGEKGPPLVHRIYEPSHHDDNSFYRAVQQGVQAHHWSYGDMPPAPGVSNQDMRKIISYVRALQVANGIR